MSECSVPFKTCHQKIKLECLKAPKSKLTQFDPKKENECRSVIKDIERIARYEAKKTEVKLLDLSTSLPPPLYERVSRIIPMPPLENDTFEVEPKGDDFEEEQLDEMKSFHESQITEVVQQQKEFSPIQLRIEEDIVRKSKHKEEQNWISEYICLRRKDRIKWQSKLYELEKKFSEKPLYEQAEYLTDAAAERFTNWVNELSDNKDTNIDKDILKSLFSLNTGSGHLTGMHIEPKQVRAVPNEVAETWQLPEKSIQLKFFQYLQARAKKAKTKHPTVAFGRTLPNELKAWVPLDADTPIKPSFPKKLLTRETIFKGIENLRSTKALIHFYKKNPEISRPQYLVKEGYFKTVEKKQIQNEIPFYELLNN